MSKRKNDFWDSTDDELQGTPGEQSENEEEWSAVKSLPLKIIMRILLMLSFIATAVSGFVIYGYVSDRYVNGSFNNDFFSSRSFAEEYDSSVDDLFSLLDAMEQDSTVTDPGSEERLATMIENYMGKDTNFSFMIQDSNHNTIASSGDDARQRIEASSHYLLLTSDENGASINSTLPGTLLESSKWEQELADADNQYVIYTAVDDELTQKDAFYEAQQSFNQTAQYFRYARIVGIIAVIIFIICLVFSILSTGMKHGYDEVQLNWFDKIPTEIAIIIMLAGDYALYRLIRMFFGQTGSVNAFGLSKYLTYTNISYVLMIVAYIWFMQCFFSVIRRIKAGTFYRKSIIGRIIIAVSNAIGRLPSALCVLLTIIILVAVNGGVVYGCLFMRQYTVKGIPIAFLVAGVTFIYEIMAIVAHSHDKNMEEQAVLDEDSDLLSGEEETEPAEEKQPHMSGKYKSASAVQTPEVPDVPEVSETPAADDQDKMDFESIDLGQAVEEAQRKKAESDAARQQTRTSSAEDRLAAERAADAEKTMVLSEDDIQKAINASAAADIQDMQKTVKNAAAPETASAETQAQPSEEKKAEKAQPSEEKKTETSAEENAKTAEAETAPAEGIDLTHLTKTVRNSYRARLKQRGIVASVRAPGKPVMVDIDQEQAAKAISSILEQMLRLSADNIKNYAEVYTKGNKALLIVKINLAEDKLEEAKTAAEDNTFAEAEEIAKKAGGRFIAMVDDGALKVGMLLTRITG